MNVSGAAAAAFLSREQQQRQQMEINLENETFTAK